MNGSLRTQVFLARNAVWKKEQDVDEARKSLQAAQRHEEEVWTGIMAASPAVVRLWEWGGCTL